MNDDLARLERELATVTEALHEGWAELEEVRALRRVEYAALLREVEALEAGLARSLALAQAYRAVITQQMREGG